MEEQKQRGESSSPALVHERMEAMVVGPSTTVTRMGRFLNAGSPADDGDRMPFFPSFFFPFPSSPSVGTVAFKGWPSSPRQWVQWVKKLLPVYADVWRKAGIFDAVIASTCRFRRCPVTVLGVARYFCEETNSFIFPWGEASVSLEDVAVLGGFSLIGRPVVSAWYDEVAVLVKQLRDARASLTRSAAKKAHMSAWMKEFACGDGGALEHAAFLAYWLCRYVLPGHPDSTMRVQMFPLAASLAQGEPIALAPAVLASIYRDMKLMRQWFLDGCVGDAEGIVLWAPLHIVQIWVWERFPGLRPEKQNETSDKISRTAWWDDVGPKKDVTLVESVIDDASTEFVWQPYAAGDFVGYGHHAFAQFLQVCELVGVDCIEQYNPHRFARQFGFDQDLPTTVPRANANWEMAWASYCLLPHTSILPAPQPMPTVTKRYLDWWTQCMSFSNYDHVTVSRYSVEDKSSAKGTAEIGLHNMTREADDDEANGKQQKEQIDGILSGADIDVNIAGSLSCGGTVSVTVVETSNNATMDNVDKVDKMNVLDSLWVVVPHDMSGAAVNKKMCSPSVGTASSAATRECKMQIKTKKQQKEKVLLAGMERSKQEKGISSSVAASGFMVMNSLARSKRVLKMTAVAVEYEEQKRKQKKRQKPDVFSSGMSAIEEEQSMSSSGTASDATVRIEDLMTTENEMASAEISGRKGNKHWQIFRSSEKKRKVEDLYRSETTLTSWLDDTKCKWVDNSQMELIAVGNAPKLGMKKYANGESRTDLSVKKRLVANGNGTGETALKSSELSKSGDSIGIHPKSLLEVQDERNEASENSQIVEGLEFRCVHQNQLGKMALSIPVTDDKKESDGKINEAIKGEVEGEKEVDSLMMEGKDEDIINLKNGNEEIAMCMCCDKEEPVEETAIPAGAGVVGGAVREEVVVMNSKQFIGSELSCCISPSMGPEKALKGIQHTKNGTVEDVGNVVDGTLNFETNISNAAQVLVVKEKKLPSQFIDGETSRDALEHKSVRCDMPEAVAIVNDQVLAVELITDDGVNLAGSEHRIKCSVLESIVKLENDGEEQVIAENSNEETVVGSAISDKGITAKIGCTNINKECIRVARMEESNTAERSGRIVPIGAMAECSSEVRDGLDLVYASGKVDEEVEVQNIVDRNENVVVIEHVTEGVEVSFCQLLPNNCTGKTDEATISGIIISEQDEHKIAERNSEEIAFETALSDSVENGRFNCVVMFEIDKRVAVRPVGENGVESETADVTKQVEGGSLDVRAEYLRNITSVHSVASYLNNDEDNVLNKSSVEEDESRSLQGDCCLVTSTESVVELPGISSGEPSFQCCTTVVTKSVEKSKVVEEKIAPKGADQSSGMESLEQDMNFDNRRSCDGFLSIHSSGLTQNSVVCAHNTDGKENTVETEISEGASDLLPSSAIIGCETKLTADGGEATEIEEDVVVLDVDNCKEIAVKHAISTCRESSCNETVVYSDKAVSHYEAERIKELTVAVPVVEHIEDARLESSADIALVDIEVVCRVLDKPAEQDADENTNNEKSSSEESLSKINNDTQLDPTLKITNNSQRMAACRENFVDAITVNEDVMERQAEQAVSKGKFVAVGSRTIEGYDLLSRSCVLVEGKEKTCQKKMLDLSAMFNDSIESGLSDPPNLGGENKSLGVENANHRKVAGKVNPLLVAEPLERSGMHHSVLRSDWRQSKTQSCGKRDRTGMISVMQEKCPMQRLEHIRAYRTEEEAQLCAEISVLKNEIEDAGAMAMFLDLFAEVFS